MKVIDCPICNGAHEFVKGKMMSENLRGAREAYGEKVKEVCNE